MEQPPITQWCVTHTNGMSIPGAEHVNSYRHLLDIVAVQGEENVLVFGRRRLNDYVGSPVWSEWVQVDMEADYMQEMAS